MPGIVGLITKMPRQYAEEQLRRMLGTMRHESFYAMGCWADERLGVYVGWAERGKSCSDGGPGYNSRRDVCLIFSGEEVGGQHSIGVHKHSAAENWEQSRLAECYEQDPAFPRQLNGRFHGILSDQKQGTIMLFNDRYGIHRLYYHESKDAFYFAAEAKAILAVRPELRKIDSRGLGEFVACGCVLENRTFFPSINVLPGAARWTFRDGVVEKKETYFQPGEWEGQTALTPQGFYQDIRDTFSGVLPRYFNGHQPIGMSVTGGLDTRMIMAWHKPALGSLPCYSFGGTYRDSQDVLLGRQLAKQYGQSHEVISVGDDFLSRFSHYAERTVFLTDGCTDVSHSPDLYINELAREIAPVRVTGNYGGEVLRRVRAFKPTSPTEGLFSSELLSQVHTARETYGEVVRAHPLSFAVFRQTPWHHYGLLALEQTQLTIRSPFLDNEFIRLLFQAPPSALSNNDICLRLIAEGDASLRRIRTDRGLALDEHPFGSAYRQLLEFTFKAEYAYDYGMPQWLARVDHVLSPFHVDRLFLGRHKFYHFRVWYRDKLGDYIRQMLLDSRTLSRPYLQTGSVERIVQGHLTGGRNYTTAIHKLLTLELLHRLFVDSR